MEKGIRITKLRVKNFKVFVDRVFEFNDDVNIIVGDNETGKSTLLEAIEICLNYTIRGRPLNAELTAELFNRSSVDRYLSGSLSQDTLPEILLEANLDGNPKLRGNNNTEREDSEGIYVRVYFDPDLSEAYSTFIENQDDVTTVPVEFYKTEWRSYAWKAVTHHDKKVGCLFIDPSRLHPTLGRTKYISGIINAALDKRSRTTLNLNYRQLKARFDNEPDVIKVNESLDVENEVTDKPLKITVDIDSTRSWESNLQLAVDNIVFNQIGKGEQNRVQINLALQNKANDVDIVMIEEPENHMSHMNLARLVNGIEKKSKGKQVFLTTHSSYVLNKLSVNKLCLLSTDFSRLKDVDPQTAKTLQRLPGYDTLRLVLSRKSILVEGPSDEIILKKIYFEKHGSLPEEDGIDIIVVRGIGFKTYLNIARPLRHPVRVVKDNDGDYATNIHSWSQDYKDCQFIKVFSPKMNDEYSLEPALVKANSSSKAELDLLARTILSAKTLRSYRDSGDLPAKAAFLCNWFATGNQGSKKVDSAMRIFESEAKLSYPSYLRDAIQF
ncbi:MAG: AAA family ATPase [Pseudomonadota bacterium]